MSAKRKKSKGKNMKCQEEEEEVDTDESYTDELLSDDEGDMWRHFEFRHESIDYDTKVKLGIAFLIVFFYGMYVGTFVPGQHPKALSMLRVPSPHRAGSTNKVFRDPRTVPKDDFQEAPLTISERFDTEDYTGPQRISETNYSDRNGATVLGLNGEPVEDLKFQCACDDSFSFGYTMTAQPAAVPADANELAQAVKSLGVPVVAAADYHIYTPPGPAQTYSGKLPYKKPGFDLVCSKPDTFKARGNWFREDLVSQKCNTRPRQRAMAFVLGSLLPQYLNAKKLHQNMPIRSLSITTELLKIFGHRFYGSEYDPRMECGHTTDNITFALDLEAQTCIEDEKFDVVITLDVLQQAMNPGGFFSEIARSLKPGGFHIFTVPLTQKREPMYITAQHTANGTIILHSPPKIVPKPWANLRNVITMQWGYDILDLIKFSGLETKVFYVDGKLVGLNDAEYRDVLVSRKPGVNENFPDIWKTIESFGSCPNSMYVCDVFGYKPS